tara:strand:- start:324 stop:1262 length:939 start_codon:yes stop_codon:yes gene_type:complete
MQTQEIIEREQELYPVHMSPAEVVLNATEQSQQLMDIVNQTGCYVDISGKKYLKVEAWVIIGAFNRVHADTEYVQPIKDDDNETIGYNAKVKLVKDGFGIGAAVMPCYFTESACKGKQGDAKHKASMSAAQTFATSKAYRMNFSYVAILAGYAPTPAEEMMGQAGISSQPTPDVEVVEHYCVEHQAEWFKRGKMKTFAHPIEGTDPTVWCQEVKTKPKPMPKPSPNAVESKSSPLAEETNGKLWIDTAILREMLDELGWDGLSTRDYLKKTYEVNAANTVTETLKQLDEMQQEEFFQTVNDMVIDQRGADSD